jgi:gliding motility-associated-like protein
MNRIKLAVGLLFLFVSIKSFAQNDCVDAIVICGDANLSNLETTGSGIQEINTSNACSSQENNTIWLKVRIEHGGTLGFLITPQSSNLNVDFDFWMYGPNATCGNLGTAIRCSTTNPLQAGLSYNTTGMNDTEPEPNEGPGPDGNSFINWLTVNDDDIFYLAIDRFFGDSNFTIQWTGTATFYTPPVAQAVTDLTSCGADKRAIFDLTPTGASALGSQTNVATQFFLSYSNAVTQTNAIGNPAAFQNTVEPQKIYIRLTNNSTGCFDITEFNLHVEDAVAPVLGFEYDTPVCIEGTNPVPVKAANFSAGGIFTATPAGLAIDGQTGNINLSISQAGNYNVTYSIPNNNPNCLLPETSNADIVINGCMIPRGVSANLDGDNDTFDIEAFNVRGLSIFNRYGVKVYHKDNYKKEWHGQTDSGKELPTATYYYLIEFSNGEKKTGWVYLTRQE